MSVCHAVKEEPGVRVRAVFEEGHIVAGLNAEHGKQLHGVSGDRSIRGRGGRQGSGGVGLPRGVAVDL